MNNKEQKSQVRFPLDVWEDIKRLASEDGRSVNGEIIWAVRYFIASQRKGDKRDAQKL